MREIGGYLGMEQLGTASYYPGLLAVNTGRNGLAYLIRARQIKKLYIPFFLCDSVAGVCAREACPVEYYCVDADFLPVFPENPDPDGWLYVVNYYGQISNARIAEMKSRWGKIIVDNVQAFFQKPVPGVDTIYSCRKFFGVPDGAYLATDADPIPLERDVSKDRMKHILGRFETDCASDYYRDFKENDHSFRELPLMAMSRLTENLLSGLDYEGIRQKRNENWMQLHAVLGNHNRLSLHTPDGPYMYPYYCENGMQIKKKLAEKKIYIPTLWPNVLEAEGNELEKDYTRNILPLPVDQRYGLADMTRLLKALEECK